MKRSIEVAGFSLLAALVATGSCTPTGIVGGDCADGLAACDGRCVDLEVDRANCGRCGHVCPGAESCARGACPSDGEPTSGGQAGQGAGGAAGTDAVGGAGRGGADQGAAGGTEAGAGGSETGGRPASGGAGGDRPGGGAAGSPVGGAAGATAPTGGAGGAPPTGGAGGSPPTGGVGGSPPTGGAAGGPASGGTGGGVSGGTGGVEPCVPPYDTPSRCGDCDTSCPASAPRCAPSGGTFDCVIACDATLAECDGTCVDLNNDPFHCGGCDAECPSGICQDGACVGAQFGNVVLLCMSYVQSYPGRPQETLLGNAVFLPAKNPVRMLVYAEHSAPATVSQVEATLQRASATRGRLFDWELLGTAAELPDRLSVGTYDVFLVIDQTTAPAGTMDATGSAWSTALDSFPRAGGTVVVLSGGQGQTGELIAAAGLLPLAGEADLTNTQIYNRAPADALGLNVVSQFLGLQDTCSFGINGAPDATTVFVVTDSPSGPIGEPVVIHRIFAP